MALLEDERALAWAAQVGAVELHPLLARAEALERPTALVLDLDPGPPAGLVHCCRVAVRVRELLGLEALVKTSGSAGLHVVVPLNTPVTYAETKAFARGLASALADESPLVTAEQKRSLRPG